MDRVAKSGLAVIPMLALKVLTNFWLGLVTGYEPILTNSNKKVKAYGGGEGEVVQDQSGGW